MMGSAFSKGTGKSISGGSTTITAGTATAIAILGTTGTATSDTAMIHPGDETG